MADKKAYTRQQVADFLSQIQPGVEGWRGTITANALKGMAQALMYPGDVAAGYKRPTAEGSFDTMANVAGMSGLSGLLAGPKGGATLAANVWQGGPHKYGPEGASESLKHIGKGEGAQAYGWGRYDAGAQGVAEDYKAALSPYEVRIDGEWEPTDWKRTGGARKKIAEQIGLDATPGGEMDEVVSAYQTALKNDIPLVDALRQNNDKYLSQLNDEMSGATGEHFKSRAKVFLAEETDRLRAIEKKVSDAGFDVRQTQGYLYKHDLPDEDIARYLDWDAPLSESEMIRVYEALDAENPNFAKAFQDNWYSTNEAGREAWSGQDLYYELSKQYGSDKAASEALARAGIPGLKYLDGMSRGKGEGSHNYVTWDQDVLDRMTLLERNGETFGANRSKLAAALGAADDLPMDEASRMARARDMGFDVDTPVYHGTPDARGINESGFSTAKERYNDWPGEGPFFFSDNRQIASTYADDSRAFDYQNAEPEVIKALLRKGDALEIDAEGAEFRGIDIDKLRSAVPEKDLEPLNEMLRDMHHFVDWDDNIISTDGLSAVAKALGKDSVVIRNVRDSYTGVGPKSDVIAVFGAKNIRRDGAKFDPAKSDSADLLAANPGTIGGPLALAKLLQQEREAKAWMESGGI